MKGKIKVIKGEVEMIYEKIKLKDISSKLKESNAVISIYIPENSEEININKKKRNNNYVPRWRICNDFG